MIAMIIMMFARNETDDDCRDTCCVRGNTDDKSLTIMVTADALTMIL